MRETVREIQRKATSPTKRYKGQPEKKEKPFGFGFWVFWDNKSLSCPAKCELLLRSAKLTAFTYRPPGKRGPDVSRLYRQGQYRISRRHTC